MTIDSSDSEILTNGASDIKIHIAFLEINKEIEKKDDNLLHIFIFKNSKPFQKITFNIDYQI